MSRYKKKIVIDYYRLLFESTSNMVLIFHVNDVIDNWVDLHVLRRELNVLISGGDNMKVKIRVVNNGLMVRSIEKSKFKFLCSLFVGPTILVILEDIKDFSLVSKVFTYLNEERESLVFLGGKLGLCYFDFKDISLVNSFTDLYIASSVMVKYPLIYTNKLISSVLQDTCSLLYFKNQF